MVLHGADTMARRMPHVWEEVGLAEHQTQNLVRKGMISVYVVTVMSPIVVNFKKITMNTHCESVGEAETRACVEEDAFVHCGLFSIL